MDLLANLTKTVLSIESSSHLVAIEHNQFEDGANAPCVVHQGTPDSPAVVICVDEKPPDFIPDQRNKTDHNSLLLEDPRFGLWQISFANVVPFPLEECLIEE